MKSSIESLAKSLVNNLVSRMVWQGDKANVVERYESKEGCS